MGLLDSLTQDLSNFFDNSKAIYDQSTGTAPSVPQVSGLLASDSSSAPSQSSQPLQGYLQPGTPQNTGIAGDIHDAYTLYKDATDPNTHGMDTVNKMLKDGGLSVLGRGAEAIGMAVAPELTAPVVGLMDTADAAKDLWDMGRTYVQNNPISYKGLLR